AETSRAAPAATARSGQAAPAATPAKDRAPAIPRKLIRTVDLRLEVKSSTDVARQIEALVSRLGGYVSASNAQRQGELLTYSLTVRVPVERFDQALAAIRGYAVRIDREHQQVEDITDQYIDMDARRRTLEATETELRGLLAEARQRGRKVDEIMAIYQQLIEIRTQIEQIQGQLNSFDKLAAFSTLNVELVPTEAARPVTDASWQPSDTVRSSIRTLINFLQLLVDFLIYAVVVLLPVGLVIAAGVLLLLWIWRRGRAVTVGGPRPGPPPSAGPGGP
ncbi:MAG: DUF4349 domain-containing protein, partial [Thermoanaerobaculia bacterium]